MATQATATARIYRLGGVILLAIWLRSLLDYWGQLYTGLTQCHLSDRLNGLLLSSSAVSAVVQEICSTTKMVLMLVWIMEVILPP
ncbi:MAG: hypothetical protein WBM86_15100 [Waterburya sp.]